MPRVDGPRFPCKGVCLGGALHGILHLKRAETRESLLCGGLSSHIAADYPPTSPRFPCLPCSASCPCTLSSPRLWGRDAPTGCHSHAARDRPCAGALCRTIHDPSADPKLRH